MYIVKQLFFSMSLNSGRIISENCARIFPSPPFSVFVAFKKGGGGGGRRQETGAQVQSHREEKINHWKTSGLGHHLH